ncbi:MAG TPA: hypothetical protein VHE55_01715 [Fimbriimonadaceae bacterium]|nr:hypothetical protein [Fimbriimonadaceae bacterium]
MPAEEHRIRPSMRRLVFWESLKLGLAYRVRVLVPLILQVLRTGWIWLVAVIGFLSSVEQLKDLWGISAARSFFINTLPDEIKAVLKELNLAPWAAWAILAIVFVTVGTRLCADRRRMFRIATGRLNDRRKPELRAVKKNREAEILLGILNTGRTRPDRAVFDLLVKYWENYSTEDLKVLKATSGRFSYPVACVPLPDRITVNRQEIPQERMLDHLVQVDVSRRDEMPAKGRKKPGWREPRFLVRFRGPDKEQTGFRDDFEGYNITLRRLKIKDGVAQLPIDATLQQYGNIMDTSDALIQELFLFGALNRAPTEVQDGEMLSFLPWRRSIHPRGQIVDAVTNPSGRAAGFGVAALVVFRERKADGSGYEMKAIYGHRTDQVGTYKDVDHVIPAGMTNCIPPSLDRDGRDAGILSPDGYYRVTKMIEKEFLEELFKVEWASRVNEQYGTTNWVTRVDRKCEELLYGPKGRYRASIYLTGLVIDLLNYRPEICALILIDSPEWWEKFEPTGPNDAGRVQINYENHIMAKYVDVLDDNAVAQAFPPEGSVISGAAAFHLGIRKVRQLIEEGRIALESPRAGV